MTNEASQREQFNNVIWKTSDVITRHLANPLLTSEDPPYPCSLLFNAGIAKYQGRYVMVFRNDYGWGGDSKRFKGTNLGLAFSDDGVTWDVQSQPFLTVERARELLGKCYANFDADVIRRAYDPRLTVIDGRCYMCFAVDTSHGVRGGIAVTDDFEDVEILHLTVPDNRNMVLFPERVGGEYVRLERPFPIYGRGEPEAFDCWLSTSPDMRYWGNCDLVLSTHDVPFCNRKLGPAAPPIKTDKGWLTTFHAVDFEEGRALGGWETSNWPKRYTIGIMLLDLQNPAKRIGMYRQPLMVPEEPYETDEGFRQHVLFPGGMILEDDGEVKIYYGASDTVECLATAHVDDLLKLCLEG